MTDMHEGLLLCPFCGDGETTFDDLTFGSGQILKVRLRHHCGPDDWPCIEFSADTKAEAIAAWNRRASAPVPAKPVKWQARHTKGGFNGEWVDHGAQRPDWLSPDYWEIRPLYLHPAPNRDELIAALERIEMAVNHALMALPTPSGASEKRAWSSLIDARDSLRALRESMEKQEPRNDR